MKTILYLLLVVKTYEIELDKSKGYVMVFLHM